MFKWIQRLAEEICFIQQRDPVPVSRLGIVLTYPGFHAVFWHRLNHRLYRLKVPLLPNLFAYFVRFITGIEIHPGAQIGKNFFIDHGMGVVIGETAIVRNNVHIYHAVTLGARTAKKGVKRHPTIGDNVIIGAHSLVLGDIEIGKDSKIGAGSIVLDSMPEGALVLGAKSRVLVQSQRDTDIEYYI